MKGLTNKKFFEKAFILAVILTILFSGISLGTFLIYEGNLPKLSKITTIIDNLNISNRKIFPNNYTLVEIINLEQSQEVKNGSISIGYYPITIKEFYSNTTLNIYLINYENYIELNATNNISKIKNLIPIEQKFENKSIINDLEIKIIDSKGNRYYLLFENRNNFTVNFNIWVNTPKISIDSNAEKIEIYKNEKGYLKNISNISLFLLIFLFFATVYFAYRWMRENV